MTLHLTQGWTAAPADTCGSLHLTLHNLGETDIRPASFCYTSLARIDETTDVTGGTLVNSYGSFVEIVPNADIPAGGTWQVRLRGLIYGAANRTQGVITAWITTTDGRTMEATIGDLEPLDGAPRGPGKDWPPGQITEPLGLLPWPAEVAITDWGAAPILCPAPGSDPAPFQAVAALQKRLFPADPAAISLSHGQPVHTSQTQDLPPHGYRLQFGAEITLHHADPLGLQYGLTALAQMAHAARIDDRFQFPRTGEISDAPRFEWRGLMLDVSRNFHDVRVIRRVLDVMAWLRMNRFHWHLVDDEGYRIPSAAYPALNTIGASRGMGQPMPPQYGDGPSGQSGHYTPTDIAQVLDHASALGIAIMPEVEMPGHAASLIAAVPGLRDPDEPNGCYRSVQGYTNNALNPGIPKTYDVVETLLDEAAALFPFDIIHVGADEVDLAAWGKSPLAQRFAAANGLATTHELQAHFLRHVQDHLRQRGRKIAAWDEAAEGGGIAPDNALLFAWRTKEKTAELMAKGYDVVATPGQAYYLDMVEADGWDARGISWAGVSPPQNCYDYAVADGLPDGPGQLVGVQAAIWGEYLDTTDAINAIAFPRLAAVAEAGWTPEAQKSWPRFAALSRLVPRL
ncbi:beta-N-acetylhexosaminidase [Yoonia sp. SS1-5]|uniref:beta-N-acetylhexosaminidase n=1 Tax=Yoonia rhodophyticola TaxID=3137370 RepID=A0AAN0MDS0_9RHOB